LAYFQEGNVSSKFEFANNSGRFTPRKQAKQRSQASLLVVAKIKKLLKNRNIGGQP